MTQKLQALGDEICRLAPDERVYLVERLLESLDDSELEKRWIDEAVRRRQEVIDGTVQPISAEEVYRRID